MSTVTGIFQSVGEAEKAIRALRSHGIADAHLNVLASEDALKEQSQHFPVDGKKAGAAIGAYLGLSMATFLVPGLGPIAGAGMLAAGIAGAGLGAAAGQTISRVTAGFPNEDLYFFERALRDGGAIVAVEASDENQATQVRNLIERAGGRSVQSVRRDWWQHLRDRERLHLNSRGVDFQKDEPDYHAGFESALHPATRGHDYQEVIAYVETCYPEPCRTEAFRIGFDRGQEYFRNGYRWPKEVE